MLDLCYAPQYLRRRHELSPICLRRFTAGFDLFSFIIETRALMAFAPYGAMSYSRAQKMSSLPATFDAQIHLCCLTLGLRFIVGRYVVSEIKESSRSHQIALISRALRSAELPAPAVSRDRLGASNASGPIQQYRRLS